MPKTMRVSTFPHGYTPRLSSLRAAVEHAIVMSREWDEPVMLQQGKLSGDYFAEVESITAAHDVAERICWIDAPDRRKL